MTYFTDVEETIPMSIWNPQRPRIAAAILRKKNELGGIIIAEITRGHGDQNRLLLA